jgi:hypothetical protein
MKSWNIIRILGLALVLSANSLGSVALAQFGVGIGGWNWGGHTGFGSWFGVSAWPYYGHSRSREQPKAPPKQANGILSGTVSVQPLCPGIDPHAACPLIPDALSNVTISAEPFGSTQWISGRLDARGHYQLTLPPGGYTVSVHHPTLDKAGDKTAPLVRQIIIQPGQTNRQDFEIYLPVE